MVATVRPHKLHPPLKSETKIYTLTIRRAVSLTSLTGWIKKTVQTDAQSVGQALAEAGYMLYGADRLVQIVA